MSRKTLVVLLTFLAVVFLVFTARTWLTPAPAPLTGAACPALPPDQVRATVFDDNNPRDRGVAVRVTRPIGEPRPACRSVLDRSECRVETPGPVKVRSGRQVQMFDIPVGRSARIAAQGPMIACVLDPMPVTGPPAAG